MGIPRDENLSTPDEALVRQIVADGSELAFRVLYRRHSPRLFRLAIRLLGSETDAEDVLQDAWFRAVPRLSEFEWRSQLGTWLCSFVVNLSRDLIDRRGRWTTTDIDDVISWLESPETPDTVDIEKAIATLPPRSRAVFVLHDIEGFTHDEIGAQLGCDAGTSKSQLFRARRALRRMLGDARVEESPNAT